MSKISTIKRKKRFFENISFDSYTGLIFVSSFLPKVTNTNKPLRINVTNLYFYKNNMTLLDTYIPESKIYNYICKNYKLKDNIKSIDNIYLDGEKVIYLIYLKHDTNINNFTKFRTLNLFKVKDYESSYNNDIYQAIYNRNKILNCCNIKLLYDENNYVKTNINSIFYYLIGNDNVK